jgi:paraquat-inducible protein B
MSQHIPEIEESTKFNFITSIWIVPLVALFIAGWLAYQYYSELGPEIRIIFPKNEGLQAGQSHIKYRDVPVGTVSKIELQENGDGVVVIARMDKTVTPYLNEHSKFWIVKPEVGVSGVSGLDTLISGTYINMYAKQNGVFKEKYVGLDHAYRNIGGGEYFVLNTPRGDSSVKVGTPIYLKNVKVGQVEYVVLALDDASVDVIVFIDKLYTPYIHTDSKFWVRSTLDVGLQNGNLDVTVAPVTDLIQGAIEFSTRGKEHNSTVPHSFIFKLYKNKNSSKRKKVGEGGNYIKTFMLHTVDTIAKLKQDAVVRYDGFEVGKVKEITLAYDKSTHKMKGKVLVKIDTSVFEDSNDTEHTGEENFYQAVKEGLRAQIIPTDPITGSLYVDLTFEHNDTERTITKEGRYTLLPTVSYSSGDLMASATKILDKINNLPLDKLVASLNRVINEASAPVGNANDVLLDLKKTVKNLNRMTDKRSFAAMPDEVNRMLKELTRTLQTTKKVVKGYDSNSLITKQLSQTLKIVTETSKEMQQFLEMLNRKPNSLIFGDH